jgi:hypothetical protein
MSEMTQAKQTGRLLTIPGHPREWLKSSYGTVTYQMWCEKEAERLTLSGRPSMVVTAPGQVAVAKRAK